MSLQKRITKNDSYLSLRGTYYAAGTCTKILACVSVTL